MDGIKEGSIVVCTTDDMLLELKKGDLYKVLKIFDTKIINGEISSGSYDVLNLKTGKEYHRKSYHFMAIKEEKEKEMQTQVKINGTIYDVKNDDLYYGLCMDLIESYDRVMKLLSSESKNGFKVTEHEGNILVSFGNENNRTISIDKVKLLSAILGTELVKVKANLDIVEF